VPPVPLLLLALELLLVAELELLVSSLQAAITAVVLINKES